MAPSTVLAFIQARGPAALRMDAWPGNGEQGPTPLGQSNGRARAAWRRVGQAGYPHDISPLLTNQHSRPPIKADFIGGVHDEIATSEDIFA